MRSRSRHALLAEIFHLAAPVTGDPVLARMADETVAELLRDRRHPVVHA